MRIGGIVEKKIDYKTVRRQLDRKMDTMTMAQYCDLIEDTIGWSEIESLVAMYITGMRKVRFVEMVNRILGQNYKVSDICNWEKPLAKRKKTKNKVD